MADAELRRAKREGGDEAVAEVMKRRMRAGELEPWKVQLLSWLHCRPAMLIYEVTPGGDFLGATWNVIAAKGVRPQRPWITTVFCAGLLKAFEDLVPYPEGAEGLARLGEITSDLRDYCYGGASLEDLTPMLPVAAEISQQFANYTTARSYARAVMHALTCAQAASFERSHRLAMECLGVLSDACYFAWEDYAGAAPGEFPQFERLVESLDSTCKAINPDDFERVVEDPNSGYYFDLDVISECASAVLSRVARGFVHDWLLR